MVTLEHLACYQGLSGASRENGLRLACAANQTEAPLFFQGHLTSPRRTAQMLLALTRVVASRFHTPAAMLARVLREADPVVTCAPQRLRWEGFSACCSAYARVDLLPEAVDGALLAFGTTNVDLGQQARNALSQLNQASSCGLTVGAHYLEVAEVVERKVALPLRWLKGLVEVQASMSAMRRIWEIPGAEARRFLQSLPKGPSREAAWVVPAGRGLRLSQVACREGVRLTGWQRLTVLTDLMAHCRSLRIYTHPGGASAWELISPDSHFHLVISPEVWRGFSGEGQLLFPLNRSELGSSLSWGQVLDRQTLLQQGSLAPGELEQSLALLANQGQLGYDLDLAEYFYRPLPYPFARFVDLHPRLQQAKKLTVDWQDGQAWVDSSGTTYRVAWQGHQPHCNCPWYARHQLERGPCKHILAAQLDLEKEHA
jgi:hypothetical protein